MFYSAKKRLLVPGYRVELYSLGRNGVDDGGKGDDLSYESLARRWLRRGKAALDLVDDLTRK